MRKVFRVSWIILVDIAGVSLLIVAALLGWLPGLPGIPIALLGLGLLAINHEWAARLLGKVKAKGIEIKDKIFKKKA